MYRVVGLLICVLYVTGLPVGITQSISADQFRLLVEERVKNLSLVADNAYLNITGIRVCFSASRDYRYTITGERYRSCPYGNQLYDTCSVERQPNDIVFDGNFMRNISTSTSSVYFRQFLAGYAAEFSSIDDYQILEVC